MRHFSSRFDDARGRREPSLEDEEDQEPPRLRFRPTREKDEGDGDENSRHQGDADGGNGGKEKEKEEEEEDEEEEEEDDYMNMTFADAAPAMPETSLQRRERLRREGLRRGHVPSKAELAAQERERREEGLSRSLIPDAAAAAAGPTTSFTSAGSTTATSTAKKSSSKGLAMMAKMGFKPGSALGRGGDDGGGAMGARSEPLRIEVKEDRGGIGADAERKRRMQEAAGAAGLAKRARVEELGDYRERMARERAAARREGQVAAAQKIAERMDEEAGVGDVGEASGGGGGQGGSEDGEGGRGNRGDRGGGDRSGKMSSRPLRSVPVLYRGLVRQREEKERDRRMRYDLEQGSGGLSARLPTYDDDDGTMDADDRIALGRTEKKKTVYMPADDLDEEDPELDEFNELDGDEKLKRILKYLREKYRYCFWCKCAYPDKEMEGCPGLTEEDHD